MYLTSFYEKYNTVRLHGSTAFLPPTKFHQEWEKGNILEYRDAKKRAAIPTSHPNDGPTGKRVIGEYELEADCCSNRMKSEGGPTTSPKAFGKKTRRRPIVAPAKLSSTQPISQTKLNESPIIRGLNQRSTSLPLYHPPIAPEDEVLPSRELD